MGWTPADQQREALELDPPEGLGVEYCPGAPPDDPIHCQHWYDAEKCCRCGAGVPVRMKWTWDLRQWRIWFWSGRAKDPRCLEEGEWAFQLLGWIIERRFDA